MLLQLVPCSRLRAFALIPVLLAVFSTAAGLPQVGQENATPVESSEDAYYHYSLGMTLYLDGDYKGAISEFELALEADPDDPHLMSRFAQALSKAGYITRAVEMRQKAVELSPEDPALRYALARVYFDYRAQESMRLKAEAELEKTLELDPAHTGALLDLGQIYWETERWEDVIRVFSKLRQLDPTIVRAYLAEAQSLERLNRLPEAVEVRIARLSVGRRLPDYMILLGSYLEQLERFENAEEIYLDGLQGSSEPQTTQFKQRLAFLYNNMEEFEKALPFLQDLNASYPGVAAVKVELARALRNTGKLEEALEMLDRAIIISPDDVQANYELSVVLAKMGRLHRAIEVIEHLLALDNEEIQEFNLHFRIRLALLYGETGNHIRAVEILKEVVSRDPEDTDIQLRLLQAYRDAGMHDQASRLSEQLLQENPADPYVIIGRGQTLAAQGKVNEGVRFLKEIARSDLDQEERVLIYLVLGQILLKEKRFDEAHRMTDEGLSLKPDDEDSSLLFLKASVFEGQGDLAEAERIFRKLLEDSPEDTSVMNYLGYMFVENDLKLEEAGELLEKAVSLEPYNGAFQDSLGWLYYKLGDLDKAEEHLLKANSLEHSDPVILEHLGDLYQKIGDVNAARDYYRSSIDVSESVDDSRRVLKKLRELPGK